VPAAFCRKAVVSTKEFEVWGDGKQTRSFMFIDDCVEGSIRILLSDCAVPLNLGKFALRDVPCRVLLCVRCGYFVKACY
jgi:GDP-D-mannose 3',5'-epimerase